VLGTSAGEDAAGDTRVVDQDIEIAVTGVEVVERGLVARGLGYVEEDRVSAGSEEFFEGQFTLFQVSGTDDNFDAGAAEFECGLESDAAVAAGDECDFLLHDGNISCSGLDSPRGRKGA
jgi:hypothetical protein